MLVARIGLVALGAGMLISCGGRSALLGAPSDADARSSPDDAAATDDGLAQDATTVDADASAVPDVGGAEGGLDAAVWDGEYADSTLDADAPDQGELDQDVPDQIEVGPTPTELTVTRDGMGLGTVMSTPAGIDCGTACATEFPPGASVQLTTSPAPGSWFDGWDGPCSGLGACDLVLDKSLAVTARFGQPWSRRYGDAKDQSALDLDIGNPGATYVAGIFQGSLDFGASLVTSPNRSGFVVSLGPKLQPSWTFVSPGESWMVAVAATPNDGVVALGGSSEAVSCGGGAAAPPGIQLVRIARDGTCRWARSFDNSFPHWPEDTAVDSDGNVFITGFAQGSLDFGGGTLAFPALSRTYVAKFDPNGAHLWSKRFQAITSGYDQSEAIVAAPNGDLVVVGDSQVPIDLGGGLLEIGADGGRDIFAARYSANGAHVWSRSFTSGGYWDVPLGVAVAPSGDLVIAGSGSGPLDLGAGPMNCSAGLGTSCAFIVMLDDKGATLWSWSAGGPGGSDFRAVTVDSEGIITAVGDFSDSIQVGSDELTSAGDWDVFVVRLGPNGEFLGGRRFGDNSGQSPVAAVAGPAGNVLLAGDFGGSMGFGDGSILQSAGGADIFLANLAPW